MSATLDLEEIEARAGAPSEDRLRRELQPRAGWPLDDDAMDMLCTAARIGGEDIPVLVAELRRVRDVAREMLTEAALKADSLARRVDAAEARAAALELAVSRGRTQLQRAEAELERTVQYTRALEARRGA